MKEKDLKSIEELPKHDREVTIGKMIRKDKQIGRTIRKGITDAKRLLFQTNSVQSDEIQSIRNDAVFIIGRRLRTTTFGPIEFREKNVYSMYMKVEGIEFYLDRTRNTVDVKGIKDDIVNEPDHQEGMVRFITTVMNYLVMDRRDALRRYLIQFSEDYKAKKLPYQYYREFGPLNAYRTNMEVGDYSYSQEFLMEEDMPMVNGVYNYKRFVLPMIQQYL